MTLANLFVELVVTGCHTLLWVGLLGLTLTGYQNISWEKLFALELALPFLALSYLLGIIVDKVADGLFMRIDNRVRQRLKPKDLPDLLTVRFHILHHAKDLYEPLEYIRSRLRIARAAGLNFVFTTLCALLFVRFQLQSALVPAYVGWVYVGVLLSGGLLTCASVWAWAALNHTYLLSLIAAYRLLKAEPSTPPTAPTPKKGR